MNEKNENSIKKDRQTGGNIRYIIREKTTSLSVMHSITPEQFGTLNVGSMSTVDTVLHCQLY